MTTIDKNTLLVLDKKIQRAYDELASLKQFMTELLFQIGGDADDTGNAERFSDTNADAIARRIKNAAGSGNIVPLKAGSPDCTSSTD